MAANLASGATVLVPSECWALLSNSTGLFYPTSLSSFFTSVYWSVLSGMFKSDPLEVSGVLLSVHLLHFWFSAQCILATQISTWSQFCFLNSGGSLGSPGTWSLWAGVTVRLTYVSCLSGTAVLHCLISSKLESNVFYNLSFYLIFLFSNGKVKPDLVTLG